jgi:hypothetical protein
MNRFLDVAEQVIVNTVLTILGFTLTLGHCANKDLSCGQAEEEAPVSSASNR